MGVDYYATAAIGLRVCRSQVTEKVRRKTFAHDHPESWTVDPVSGKKLWNEWEELVDVSPYEFVDSGEDDGSVVIALRQVTTESSRSDSAPAGIPFDIERADVEDFRLAMQDKKLWNVNDFGLWAVLYVSC